MWKNIILTIIFLTIYLVNTSPAQTTEDKAIETNQLSDWLLVKTENFAVVSNTDPERAKLIAYKLEQYRYALSLLTPNLVASSPIPARVHVYRNGSSYSAGLPIANQQVISGYFQPGSDLISINDLFNISDNVSYHEYIHLLTRSDITYPLWFSEGIAEFYETFEISDHKVRLGEVNPSRLHVLKLSGFIPLNKLLKFNAYSQVIKETTLDLYYAESWFLTHYLMMDEERRAKLIDFLERQSKGQDIESAFEQAFQYDLNKLEENLKSYLAINKYKIFVFNFDGEKIDSDIEIISLSEEEKVKQLKDLPNNSLSVVLRSRGKGNKPEIIPDFAKLPKTVELKCILSDKSPDIAPSDPEKPAKAKAALEKFILANQLFEDNKKDEALVIYEEVVKLDPDFAPAYMQMGNIYSTDKFFDQARLAYEKARSIAPNYAGTYLNQAISQYEQGKIDEAESSFRTALSLYPSSAPSHLGLGNIYLQRRDYKRARNEFTKTLSLVRNAGLEAVNAHVGLAACYFYQGQYEKAKEHYILAIKLEPNNYVWHRAFADSCLMLKQYEQAQVAYLKAIKLNAKDEQAQTKLAWIEKYNQYLRAIKQHLTRPKTEPVVIK